jgi:XTP/dITP diphosphohydrolase
VAAPSGATATVSGCCEGRISRNAQGEGGFGYDPLFIPAGRVQSFGQLTAEEKNQISHRARALAQLPALLRQMQGAGAY